ncbi:MAG: 50S ribosomal protein L13 [Alphaproteobacteria bacterium]|jgi:large subunit ribosomal protein L13|nr:50S ribosomal protein L13 [Alphaproteobacteria bacterium]MBT5828471.1 50S ribosomal protein L13 [Alphaproteobacteria bacterium]
MATETAIKPKKDKIEKQTESQEVVKSPKIKVSLAKTSVNKLSDIKKNWYLIDVQDIVLGRAAAHIATILRGKNKVDYTPFLDCGDNVVVINSDKIKLKGNKLNDKTYYWHTGYPGGIKDITAKKFLEKDSTKMFRRALKGMLPRGPLGRKQLSNLHVFKGAEHAHEAQKPELIDLSKLNNKNSR